VGGSAGAAGPNGPGDDVPSSGVAADTSFLSVCFALFVTSASLLSIHLLQLQIVNFDTSEITVLLFGIPYYIILHLKLYRTILSIRG
jgi:hypothetical protein